VGICSQHISLLHFKLFCPSVYSLKPLPKFYVFFLPPLFSSRAVRVHLTPFQPPVQLFTLITSNRCSLDASLETPHLRKPSTLPNHNFVSILCFLRFNLFIPGSISVSWQSSQWKWQICCENWKRMEVQGVSVNYYHFQLNNALVIGNLFIWTVKTTNKDLNFALGSVVDEMLDVNRLKT